MICGCDDIFAKNNVKGWLKDKRKEKFKSQPEGEHVQKALD